MNTFDKNFLFKQAQKKDLKRLMNFIKTNGKKKHILAHDSSFFKYEYMTKEKINFLIAINKKDKKIYAIHGFIPYSNNKKNLHICGSVGLTKINNKYPFLGIETFKRMLSLVKHNTYCGIGTNPKTMLPLIKKFFKRYTGKMIHFYYLNKNLKKFKIAQIKKRKFSNLINSKVHFEEIFTFNQIEKKMNFVKKNKNLPYKSKAYIKKRYFDNQYFKYRFYLINKKNLLIGREIFQNKQNRSIFSIVDFIGNVDQMSKIKNLLDYLIKKNNYEYIDLLTTKNMSKNLIKSGFIKKHENDKNIIPIYFDPFVKKNVTIHYETSKKNFIYFKADADQDRPSKYNN